MNLSVFRSLGAGTESRETGGANQDLCRLGRQFSGIEILCPICCRLFQYRGGEVFPIWASILLAQSKREIRSFLSPNF